MASQKASKGIPGSASNKQKQAMHLRYRNEDRAWWSKINRLRFLLARAERRGRTGYAAELRKVLSDVVSRARIDLRTAFKNAA